MKFGPYFYTLLFPTKRSTHKAVFKEFGVAQISKASESNKSQIWHKERLRTGMRSPLVLINACFLKETRSNRSTGFRLDAFLFVWLLYSSFPDFHRELLLNNNCLRVLPYELGRLFRLQTLGLKGRSLFILLRNSFKHLGLYNIFSMVITFFFF